MSVPSMSVLPNFVAEFSRPVRTEKPRLMIDPRSYLADRVVPDLELSIIPSRDESKAYASLSADGVPRATMSFLPRRQRVRPSSYQKLVLPDDKFAVDLRVFGLGNWAHALNTGVPIALKVADLLQERGLAKPTLILNEKLSGKVTGFFRRLGFEVIETDKVVQAPLVTFEEQGHVLHGLHGLAHNFLAPHLDWICTDVLQATQDFGDRIFLNRKSTRNLKNSTEIVGLLEQKGFRTIYAEDWNLDEQFQMILRAKEIVAIHGAAIAPLLYRRPQDGDLRFVEIFPPGHVVPFYLHMTYRLQCQYLGVRGALDRSMLPGLYEQAPHKTDFTQKHSLRPFYLDPESLELALSPDRIRERFGGVSDAWPIAGDGA